MWVRSPGKLYLQKQELCVHPRMESRVTNRHHTLHSEQHRSQQSGGGSSPSAHQWANRQAMIAYAHHRVWVSLKDGGSSDTCGKTGVNLDIMLGQQTRHRRASGSPETARVVRFTETEQMFRALSALCLPVRKSFITRKDDFCSPCLHTAPGGPRGWEFIGNEGRVSVWEDEKVPKMMMVMIA